MNELKHLAEFQKILEDYHISGESQRILKQTSFVPLIAPSSGGRNTIIRELLKTGDYYFIISDTTRKPRMNDGILEQNGVEYWFRKEEDLLADLQEGKFLEAEVLHGQQVSGISIRELKKAHDQQKIAITDMDIGGAHSVMEADPDARPIMVLPPSFEEWQRRLNGRGKMPIEELKRRLETALRIFTDCLQNDYFHFVINDTVENAIEQVHQAAKLDIVDSEKQAAGRRLAEQLYIETKIFLENTRN